ncbi:MAG: fatty acid desaturase [Rhodospirillaceae bacterium]|nr:fatty acid desaturase [Rhodospirillaceae bacterium]MDD9916961.1 fatty acid desaturase [Rhodospirillaceae bacterium]
MTTLDANADLLKRQREIISRKELKPFTKRSDRPGLIYFGGLLACIFATGFLVSLSEGSRWLWPAMLLHGVMLGHLFAPLHECCHGTAFRTRWLNEAVLWFCGIVTIWTPIYFRYDHAGHHTFAQEHGKDPEFVLPSPRTFLGYLYYVSAIHLWIKNFGWLFRHAGGYMRPFNKQFVPDSELPRIYFEARIMLTIYAVLLVFSIAAQSWVIAIYWFIPTIIGVPIARMLRVADHTGCTEGPDLRTYARTVKTDPITRFFCWDMSYHCEHHLAPSVPFHQLRALHEKIGHELNPVDKGYIAVQWEVLTRHLSGFASPKRKPAPAE